MIFGSREVMAGLLFENDRVSVTEEKLWPQLLHVLKKMKAGKTDCDPEENTGPLYQKVWVKGDITHAAITTLVEAFISIKLLSNLS